MPFLYSNHVMKAHLEDTPVHQGVVVSVWNDIPLVSVRIFFFNVK